MGHVEHSPKSPVYFRGSESVGEAKQQLIQTNPLLHRGMTCEGRDEQTTGDMGGVEAPSIPVLSTPSH